MSRENPLWGAPRIHGELLKLGIDVGETSVSKYLIRRRNPPSQTWRTFLENHLKTTVSIDFFTVPTIRFQVLYVFLVLAHDRRRIVHFNVTAHPKAEWTGQQLREAFPFEEVPRYLLRDRDGIFGAGFTKEVRDLGIQEVLSAPRSPWQRAYIERVIGSIRRECIDHVIVLNEASLYRHLKSILAYYHESRTHLSLEKDSPATGRCNRRALGQWLRCRNWVDFIIGTNVGRRELAGRELLACDHIGGAMSRFGWRAPGALGQPVSCHRQRADQCRRHCDRGTFACRNSKTRLHRISEKDS